MRWKEAPKPKRGAKRVASWFAILPIVVGAEWRWLETVTVEFEFYDPHPQQYAGWWRAVRFVDEGTVTQ